MLSNSYNSDQLKNTKSKGNKCYNIIEPNNYINEERK